MDRRRTAFGLLGDTLGTEDILNTPVRRGGILPVTEYADRTEFDPTSGLLGALWDAFTAPDRARRGQISEADMIPEAFNFAGSLTLGSLLAPRPTGSIGMGGRAAKGALEDVDLEKLLAETAGWKPKEPKGGAMPVSGARRALAESIGFDPDTVWYRGMRHPYSEAWDKDGFHYQMFTSSPAQAGEYAMANPMAKPNVLAAHVRPGKAIDVDAGNSNFNYVSTQSLPEDIQKAIGSPTASIDQIAHAAKAIGYDSVTVRNVFDNAGGERTGAPTNVHVALNPSNIRSVNAAFDPAQSSSANLLAANAKTGAAVPLATRALEAQQPQGIRAFHGSPHDFDKFSMDAIGTGEGAQAYGHGLYFAEAEDVAKSYRDNLGAQKAWSSNDIRNAEPMLADRLVQMGYPEEVASSVAQTARLEHTMNTSEDQLTNLYGNRDATFQSALRDAWAMRNEVFGGPPGHMYEVRINADPADFLDWDKPLSQQSDKVMAALSGIEYQPPGRGMRIRDYAETIGAAPNSEATKHLLGDKQINVTGSDIMNMLGTYTGHGKPSSSAVLQEAGIPGIRYLDQMSRGEGKGSSNYVVFDDALIEIMRKYGLLGPVAGLGAAGLLADDGGQVY